MEDAFKFRSTESAKVDCTQLSPFRKIFQDQLIKVYGLYRLNLCQDCLLTLDKVEISSSDLRPLTRLFFN
jgi:hypothetical protein